MVLMVLPKPGKEKDECQWTIVKVLQFCGVKESGECLLTMIVWIFARKRNY